MGSFVRCESADSQSKKLREIGEALIAAGYRYLDDQAWALGLPRSTTWTILNNKRKNSGLSPSVINKMLAQPQLPRRVRRKLLEYVEQKSSGVYGHNPQQVRRFASGLTGVDFDGADCGGHSLRANVAALDGGHPDGS
jgi:hypothetical protein